MQTHGIIESLRLEKMFKVIKLALSSPPLRNVSKYHHSTNVKNTLSRQLKKATILSLKIFAEAAASFRKFLSPNLPLQTIQTWPEST